MKEERQGSVRRARDWVGGPVGLLGLLVGVLAAAPVPLRADVVVHVQLVVPATGTGATFRELTRGAIEYVIEEEVSAAMVRKGRAVLSRVEPGQRVRLRILDVMDETLLVARSIDGNIYDTRWARRIDLRATPETTLYVAYDNPQRPAQPDLTHRVLLAVQDSEGQPIEGATITVAATDSGPLGDVVTNLEGFALMAFREDFNPVFRIQAEGYQPRLYRPNYGGIFRMSRQTFPRFLTLRLSPAWSP